MSAEAESSSVLPSEALKGRPRQVVIGALGVTQILAWGSSYYLLAVLAGPISADMGWPLPWIFGAFSAGMEGRLPLAPTPG